jgi:hypothetical protein
MVSIIEWLVVAIEYSGVFRYSGSGGWYCQGASDKERYRRLMGCVYIFHGSGGQCAGSALRDVLSKSRGVG